MADSAENPPIARVDGPLDAVNDAFHESYDRTRADAEEDGPILVVLADELVLVRGKTEARFPVTPRAFHVIKSIAHAPIALWVLLQRPDGRPAVDALHASMRRSLDTLDADVEDPEAAASLRQLLELTLAATRDDLGRVAQAVGPLLLRAIDDATKLQLTALHARTDEIFARLAPGEEAKLRVAVTGDHQARVRSLGMQYFRKRLADPEDFEDRVLYAEGVTDATEAAALVGKQRLDRAIAKAFFGDEKRLQRDVLGDAAKARLAAL